ncbi:MAG: hypothetical protein WCO94_12735 [Verrucomicrobiota bacterium]
MNAALLLAVQPSRFFPQIRQPAARQRLVLSPQRALNLLAANAKPRKINAVIADIEIFANSFEFSRLVGSHAEIMDLPKWLTSSFFSSQKNVVSRLI